ADPAYLYLVLEGGPELDVSRYVVGIDTHRGAGGERRLPGVAGASDVGFEFALVLNDTTDAQLLVVPAYNPYLVPRAGAGPTALDAFYHWGATLEGASAGGAWDSLFVTTNRWRDGRTYAARGVNRGRLRYGRAAASSLADWYVDRDAGLVEVRLAWGLLNVTDPSSRRVLRRIALPDRFETTVSEGLRFTAQLPDAEAAFKRGDYRAARAAYERVLAGDSSNVRALYQLAILDSWDGKLVRSLERFARLRRLAPHDSDIMVAQARVLAWAD